MRGTPSPGMGRTKSRSALHWSAQAGWSGRPEQLAVEGPLAIEVAYPRSGNLIRRVLAVTMRTPGNDEELALGLLRAEGILRSLADIGGGRALGENARGEKIPTWSVELKAPPAVSLERASRSLITSSACGLCGRPSLEGLPLRSAENPPAPLELSLRALTALPERLRDAQSLFSETGGSHGAGLFDRAGRRLIVREDVGRHNAVDKVFGAALLARVPTESAILVLSGRASFELVQKASAAGIGLVVAVGAPSSLAVSLASASGIALVGFARDGRFNAYAHADRLAPAGAAQPSPS